MRSGSPSPRCVPCPVATVIVAVVACRTSTASLARPSITTSSAPIPNGNCGAWTKNSPAPSSARSRPAARTARPQPQHFVLTRRARAKDCACSFSPMHGSLSSRRRRPTQRTVGPSDSQGETPNSFSTSAIIGCVKPAAVRNVAKSFAITSSHRLSVPSDSKTDLPL